MADKGPWGRRNAGTRLYKAALAPIATDATNKMTAAAIDADEVMLHCRTAALKVSIGPTPDATAGYNFILEPTERFHVRLNRGIDKIAATQVTAAGVLEITPVQG